ncbi:MAG: DUF881 domain-containing protein [Actinobacteria bacterium]|jgi:uncharacterized protein YlxW (UPF0749 family)|nr:DUF881 domain-containing protein [Micrococcales bacterium]MCB0903744.1 DUF881 domain-containing protein [Actinomycetota bacterium]MCO5299724.1 DUF881 domain-containing protein [Candidatus Nanopelagicales bacterium]MCB9428425.1 DUF881 domain-containing protein [Actinomycetota bacterium]HPE13866.1 DUF881 domain-containing protein [Actinomycetota bacterium]
MKYRQWGVVIVCILIGIGTVAVVRGQDSEEFLATAREPDLIRLLDDLQSRQTRLDGEILRLQAAEQNLRTGTTAEALQQAQERADDLRVLAGTTPVSGPGIRLRIEGEDAFFASDLLNTVQELRDAGAEAIEINGIRVVVDTWFADARDAISVSGTQVTQPFEILAIGGPATMATAMRIPGGIADTVSAQDGSVVITELDEVEILSTVNLPEPDPNVTVTD